MCAVPSVAARFWIESVPILHAVVVVDLSTQGGPKEVSRVVLDQQLHPHWTSYDPQTRRVAVSGYEESGFYLPTFDPASGKVAIDRLFHDGTGQPGFDTGPRPWPHGWKGGAEVHGIVFSK